MRGRKERVEKAEALMADEGLTEAIAGEIEEQRGGLGFLLSTLRNRPKTFNPFILKGRSVYREPKAIDRKTAELVAVAAATALRCEYCLDAHMIRALEEGATMDEIMDVMLVVGAISESSILAEALRKYKQLEGKLERQGKKGAKKLDTGED